MKLRDLIKLSADFMSPGATHAPTVRPRGVTKLTSRTTKTRRALSLSPGLSADSSSSDLASHHTWKEPSASDLTIRNWRNKRILERKARRNLDPFEEGARLAASREVTGPCGCTLALGDKVTVDGVGRGKLISRKERMLTVKLANGKKRVVDQKFVHLMASARR